MKWKFLHFGIYSSVTLKYYEFIKENFNLEEHEFVFFKRGNAHNVSFKNTKVITINRSVELMKIIPKIYNSKNIIFHSLYLQKLIMVFFFQPWLLKKCNWVIWGGDLYSYGNEKKALKAKVVEMMRRVVIRNIGGIITHIKGDYELAKSWYGAKGEYYYSFMYPSNLYEAYDLSKVDKNHDVIYIQIGNSASLSNNHMEVIEKLKKYKNKSIEIICPLSYGNVGHRDKVIKEGKRIFGGKFTPITTYMPFEEYLGLLAKIDIAIFNHKRQQAMGNITTLLGLGKKVYIRNDITSWDFCKDHGLKVFSSNDEFTDLFEEMDKRIKENNIANVKNIFSEEELISDLKNIFRSKDNKEDSE